MNGMKKMFIRIAFTMMMLMALVGCGKKPLGEKALKVALEENLDLLYMYPSLEVYDFEIVDRVSDLDNKWDNIFVSYKVRNEYVDMSRQGCMTAYLYDQGWIVESIDPYNKEEWTITPLTKPDEAMVAEHVQGGTLTGNVEFEGCFAKYLYQSEPIVHELCVETQTNEVVFEFDMKNNEWHYRGTDIVEINRQWDIDGTWELIANPNLIGVHGGSAVINSHYQIMMDIELVNETVARFNIYPVGSNTEYYSGCQSVEINLDSIEKYYDSEEIVFTETVPGFYPVSYYGEITIDADDITMSGGFTKDYTFNRVSR